MDYQLRDNPITSTTVTEAYALSLLNKRLNTYTFETPRGLACFIALLWRTRLSQLKVIRRRVSISVVRYSPLGFCNQAFCSLTTQQFPQLIRTWISAGAPGLPIPV